MKSSSHRSTPACAGKPAATAPIRLPRWVYPRVCGEATDRLYIANVNLGLPPRVRGSRDKGQVHQRRIGSTPACAGKPPSSRGKGVRSEVYPRVCGEASIYIDIKQALVSSQRIRHLQLLKCLRKVSPVPRNHRPQQKHTVTVTLVPAHTACEKSAKLSTVRDLDLTAHQSVGAFAVLLTELSDGAVSAE